MGDPNQNLYEHFQQQILRQGDRPLLTTDTHAAYSGSDLDRESARLARFMAGLGVQQGDRVSVQVEKSPEALFLYLACLRAGFVYHPLNTGYQLAELEYFLGNAQPRLLVCDPGDLDTMQVLATGAGVDKVLTLDARGEGSLVDDSRSVVADFNTVHSAGDDLAALLYSSGTTGVPKGIMLTHTNLLSNSLALADIWGLSEEDCLLHALPIYHVHGLFVALGCVLLSGASMQWLPGFNATKVVQYLPRCTVMMGVPTFYTRLLAENEFDRDVVKGIRLFVSGSAPLLEETFEEFERRTGQCILERYGMTETNINTSNPLHGERRAGTVGFPLPGVTLRITDSEGNEMSVGEVGNLQVKGANVFKGYWRMPDKTDEDFTEDGFFNTGDKGRIDEDGYVAIVGRAKDMVISGGLNVYPKEIELVIDDLPGVKESAVIGLPHPDFGEAVVAVVVIEPGAELSESGIITLAKHQLANFKVPKRVVFVDELPRNAMSKVQKNLMRETYRDLVW